MDSKKWGKSSVTSIRQDNRRLLQTIRIISQPTAFEQNAPASMQRRLTLHTFLTFLSFLLPTRRQAQNLT